jgi:hypothetical protein
MLRQAFGDGVDVPIEVRHNCRIALDTNKAIASGIEVNGKVHRPNPKVRAQFGKNDKGLAYLIFGLIDEETGQPLTLTFEGFGPVPIKMCEVAVAHDEGRNVRPTTIGLNLARATVYETGAKHGTRPRDPRRNHDTAKDGNPYPRKPRAHHNRLCSKDLRAQAR